MYISNIGLISKKLENLNSQFPAQDMLVQTGQLFQFGSGLYSYGHIPFLLKQKIHNVIEKVLKKYDCALISLPVLQPESIWQKSGRLERYVQEDVMFRVLTDNGNYCLAPTAEEAVVEFANARLQSHKQLPVTFFQIGEKFRNELRARGFLLRSKSFDMMDAYSFGRNKEDLDLEYDRMKHAYIEIFEELGLNVQPVGADSGSIGGAKSEEFMCLSEIGEDNILFDPATGIAINTELLDRPDADEYLKTYYGIKSIKGLQTKKAVELGHIFQLGDKYSKSMNATFVDKDGTQKNFVMGCYGIGVSRTLAMVYEANALKDQNGKFAGVSLPVNIAPYKLCLISKDEPACQKEAKKVYDKLQKAGIDVLFDDREDLSIGARIKDTKLLGVPYVTVFGNTLQEGYVEIEETKTGAKKKVALADYVKEFSKLVK